MRGRTAVSSVSRSSGRTSRMLQYGSSSRVGRGFSNGSRMTCGRSRGGRGCQRGMAEAERPRGGSEQNDSLTGGGGGARRPVPVSPDTAPARTVSSDTSLVSACGSRRDSIVACAGSRSRHLDTRATHSAASSLPWKRCGRATNARSRLRGRGHTVNLTEDAPVRPVECDLRGLEIEHASKSGPPSTKLGGDFFFSARAVTPMPNSPKENLILGRTKKP